MHIGYVNMGLDRTQYEVVQLEDAVTCRVLWWDCGWQYNADYSTHEIMKKITSGAWRWVDGKA